MGNVHSSTVTRDVARGVLTPAMQLPGPAGPMLFHRADVERWLTSRKASA